MKWFAILILLTALTAVNTYRSQSKTYNIKTSPESYFLSGQIGQACVSAESFAAYFCSMGSQYGQFSKGQFPSSQVQDPAAQQALGMASAENKVELNPFRDSNYFAVGFGAGVLQKWGYAKALKACRASFSFPQTRLCFLGMGLSAFNSPAIWYESKGFPKEFVAGYLLQSKISDDQTLHSLKNPTYLCFLSGDPLNCFDKSAF